MYNKIKKQIIKILRNYPIQIIVIFFMIIIFNVFFFPHLRETVAVMGPVLTMVVTAILFFVGSLKIKKIIKKMKKIV